MRKNYVDFVENKEGFFVKIVIIICVDFVKLDIWNIDLLMNIL